MNLLNIRVTHREGPLSVLESAHIKDLKKLYREYTEAGLAAGLVVIQTCHRTEIFFEINGNENFEGLLSTWINNAADISFHQFVKTSSDVNAVVHLLRLFCGLDSMAIGEWEVYRQAVQAYNFAKLHGFASRNLSQIFESAIRASRRIRALAGLEQGIAELGELAAEHAQRLMMDLRRSRVLVVGTGQAGRQILKGLKRLGANKVLVTGRNPDLTKDVAEQFGVEPVDFKSFLGLVDSLDAIFVATSSEVPLITAHELEERLRGIGPKKLLIFDLSSPRNVDVSLGELEQVKLATLDDLRDVAAQRAILLEEKVSVAVKHIHEEAIRIWRLMKQEEVEPLVASMFREGEAIRRRELERALKYLPNLSQKDIAVIEQMTRSMVEGVLSSAAHQIRQAAVASDEPIMRVARQVLAKGG